MKIKRAPCGRPRGYTPAEFEQVKTDTATVLAVLGGIYAGEATMSELMNENDTSHAQRGKE